MLITILACASLAVALPDAESAAADWARSHAKTRSLEVVWIGEGVRTSRPDGAEAIEFKFEHATIEWPRAIVVEHRRLLRDASKAPVPLSPSDFDLASRTWFISRDDQGKVRTRGATSPALETYETSKSFTQEALDGCQRSPWIIARVLADSLDQGRSIHAVPTGDDSIEVTVSPQVVARLVRAGQRWHCDEVRQLDETNAIVSLTRFSDFAAIEGLEAEHPHTRSITRPDGPSLLARVSDPKAALKLAAPETESLAVIRIPAPMSPVEIELETERVKSSLDQATENARQDRRDQAARRQRQADPAGPR